MAEQLDDARKLVTQLSGSLMQFMLVIFQDARLPSLIAHRHPGLTYIIN